MANLKDLIGLAKAEGGKFFVIDESGDVKLVILPVEEYQKLLLKKLQSQVQDIDEVNRQIIRAQLSEEERKIASEPKLQPKETVVRVDLREEVIDPSFDFEGPKAELEDL